MKAAGVVVLLVGVAAMVLAMTSVLQDYGWRRFFDVDDVQLQRLVDMLFHAGMALTIAGGLVTIAGRNRS